MSRQNETKPGTLVNRSQIARIIFNEAAANGITDRDTLEKLTSQVIARLERPAAVLPGMEDLVPPTARQRQPNASDADILAMVKEFLASEKPAAPTPAPIAAREVLPKDKIEVKATPKPQIKKEVKAMPARTKGTPSPVAEFTENALTVLNKRYLKNDESPEGMFRRVAQVIASAETIYNPKADTAAWAEQYYRLMARLEFLPNSPTLMNAGRELGQLSACFVLPINDSIESIFDAVKYTAIIHKSGGGTGFSFSRLRPARDRVGSTGGVASGPISFMRAFDVATDVIKQGGTRRGANMAILAVTHPDILHFITAKGKMDCLNNFNISVAVTDEFMQALKAGGDYDLINPHTGEKTETLNARDVFNKMVELAWKTGDPGIVFIDRINDFNPTPHLGRIESTNPCGEQPLLPYESCNLGSVNLSRMLRIDGKVEIDWEKLGETVRLGVRFLDNVIDVNKFPLPQIEEMTKRTRKVGLGVMGFADMLIQLGIPYDSEEALKTAEEVMAYIQAEAHATSQKLAAERGTFPAYAGSVYDKPDGPKMRNASCTTIAPTGTLSIIASCSSGIEPLFALSYTRHILDGANFIEVNPYFAETAKSGGFYSDELLQKLANGEHLGEINGVPDKHKRVFVTAHDIASPWHVRMQAAFQRHVDNAVSKTVNFPKEATVEEVERVYMMAYEEGLKGITIYRDGSREGQVLTTGTGEQPKAETEPAKAVSAILAPRRRAKVTSGVTERVTTGCGYIYVTVNSDEQGICEVFSHLGKTGGCAAAQLEATCRLISLALRSGIDVASVVKQLKGIRCPSIVWEEGRSILSCADAIAGVLERHAGLSQPKAEGEHAAAASGLGLGAVKNVAGQCPECNSLLAYEEGCLKCPGCGYTKC